MKKEFIIEYFTAQSRLFFVRQLNLSPIPTVATSITTPMLNAVLCKRERTNNRYLIIQLWNLLIILCCRRVLISFTYRRRSRRSTCDCSLAMVAFSSSIVASCSAMMACCSAIVICCLAMMACWSCMMHNCPSPSGGITLFRQTVYERRQKKIIEWRIMHVSEVKGVLLWSVLADAIWVVRCVCTSLWGEWSDTRQIYRDRDRDDLWTGQRRQ